MLTSIFSIFPNSVLSFSIEVSHNNPDIQFWVCCWNITACNIWANEQWALMPTVLWRCWLGGRKGIRPVKTEWWVLAWLSIWSEVQTCICWCHCHSCFSKIQIGLPFWYRLTRVVLDKGQLNRCVCNIWANMHFQISLFTRQCRSTTTTV